MENYEHKRLHCKSLILNYIVSMLQADTQNKYSKILLELSDQIHKL